MRGMGQLTLLWYKGVIKSQGQSCWMKLPRTPKMEKRPMLVSSHFVMRLRGALLERGLLGRVAQLLLTLDEAEGGRAAPGGTAA